MSLELITVTRETITREQTDAVVALCSEIFHMDYSYYVNLECVRGYVLGYVDGKLVAHALWLARRLRIGEGPWRLAAYVEGVATHTDYRRRGYGSAVMRRVQQEIMGFELGALSPAVPEWYERLGWERWQGPLYIVCGEVVQETPGECVMIYRTPRTGDIDVKASLTGEWRPFDLW